jgi:hypothetical protein
MKQNHGIIIIIVKTVLVIIIDFNLRISRQVMSKVSFNNKKTFFFIKLSKYLDGFLEDMDISPNTNNVKNENEDYTRPKDMEMDMDISPFNVSTSPHSNHSTNLINSTTTNNKKHRTISISPNSHDNRLKPANNNIDYSGN